LWLLTFLDFWTYLYILLINIAGNPSNVNVEIPLLKDSRKLSNFERGIIPRLEVLMSRE
jgi:uncharacterized protein YggT (Ycf19 family)